MTDYDWSKVSRETLEGIARGLHVLRGKDGNADDNEYLDDHLSAALQQAIVPTLRTRAVVDAEIAELIRGYYRHITRPGHKDQPNWDSFSTGQKNDLNRLCAEPLAPDPVFPKDLVERCIDPSLPPNTIRIDGKVHSLPPSEPTRDELNEGMRRYAATIMKNREAQKTPAPLRRTKAEIDADLADFMRGQSTFVENSGDIVTCRFGRGSEFLEIFAEQWQGETERRAPTVYRDWFLKWGPRK